jgi:hypothetical protein
VSHRLLHGKGSILKLLIRGVQDLKAVMRGLPADPEPILNIPLNPYGILDAVCLRDSSDRHIKKQIPRGLRIWLTR